MKRRLIYAYFLFSLLVSGAEIVYGQHIPLALQHDDHVVFVGDGLFENELDYGYLEYALTTARPGLHVKFRNIGWSGDTPAGVARDHYTNPPTPYEHLIEQIKTTQPTVAIVGYGAHLAFENDEADGSFTQDLRALLDSLQAMEVRITLVSPAPHESESSPASVSVPAFNERLSSVSKQIAEIASERSLGFVDLFGNLIAPADDPNVHISDDGIHLNAYGYYLAGQILAEAAGKTDDQSELFVDVKSVSHSPQITSLSAATREVSFSIRAASLPLPMPAQSGFETGMRALRVTGLQRGRYGVWIGNLKAVTASAADLTAGISIPEPYADQAQELQRLILKKNRMYFYQYRPQNETYLVGFREYEQGQNARELQQLDPLIGELENEIGRLEIPRDVSVRILFE